MLTSRNVGQNAAAINVEQQEPLSSSSRMQSPAGKVRSTKRTTFNRARMLLFVVVVMMVIAGFWSIRKSSSSNLGIISTTPKEIVIVDGEQIKRPRIYCMVPSLYENLDNLQAIAGTYGKHCTVLKFFLDPLKEDQKFLDRIVDPVTNRSGEVVIIPMVRKNNDPKVLCSDGLPCRHIWEKVWRSWVYIAEHDIEKADYFSKIDDDTYFIPDNLRKFVGLTKRWDPNEKHYTGHYVWAGELDLISGVLSTISRKALELLAPRLREMKHEYGSRENFPKSKGTCVDRDGATEERPFARCLSEVGVLPESAHNDTNGSERVLPLGLPFSLTFKRRNESTSWYWHQKPLSRGQFYNCCALDAWGVHGFKGGGKAIRRFHNELYEIPKEELETRMTTAKNALESRNLLLVPVDKEYIKSEHNEYWFCWYMLQLRENLANNPMHIDPTP